jgi:hypothetical protein
MKEKREAAKKRNIERSTEKDNQTKRRSKREADKDNQRKKSRQIGREKKIAAEKKMSQNEKDLSIVHYGRKIWFCINMVFMYLQERK